MAEDTLSFLLANCYAAQKRTGKNKQFVFYNGDEVWKGPYSQDKIDMIMHRSQMMKIWKTPLIVHPLRSEGEWVIFPNIAADYPITSSSMNTESYSNYSYPVADRTVVDKMNYVIDKNKWIYNMPEIIEAMVHLWMLRVGDTGMFNMLVDQQKKLVYVIDYEEHGGRKDGPYFYFSRDPAKSFQWYERMHVYYAEVARRIEALNLPVGNAVKKQAIELLMQYAITPQPESVQEVYEQGQMQWKGMFGGSTTYSGYKVDVIKSGLQKYIRRGIVDKAVYCGFEMYRMGEVGGDAIVTNLYNRLRIIAAEDIGVADMGIALAVIDMVNMGNRDPATLQSAIKMLALCQKTRVSSHLYTVFRKLEARDYALSKGLHIDSSYTDEDEEFIAKHQSHPMFTHVQHEEMRSTAILFYKRLLEREYNAITWWGYFEHYAEGQKIGMRDAYFDGTKWRKSSKPITVLFDVLDVFIDTQIFRHAYFSMPSEHRVIFMMAIGAAIFQIRSPIVKIIPDQNGLDQLLGGQYTLEIDDYVIDKHTLEGSSKGKTREDFVNEGAVVHPEDMAFRIDDFYDVYMNCKDL